MSIRREHFWTVFDLWDIFSLYVGYDSYAAPIGANAAWGADKAAPSSGSGHGWALFYNPFKGQCHEIFCFRFFSWITFPQAPDNNIRIISNFFENSRRYSQVKVHHWCQRHRCQWHRWQIAASINDTGGKFATGINNAGGKFCHQFPLCCWHRWQICHRCQRYQRKICRRCQRRRWQIATGINDTGGKFAAGVVDTGGK